MRCRPGMINDGDLVGNLYRFPDKWWGFEAFGRDDHPGACVGYDDTGFRVTMIKGTDTRAAHYGSVTIVVQNTTENGLLKPTAFAIKPREFSTRRVELLTDKLIGRLSQSDLERIQSELIRLFVEKQDTHG